MEQGQITTHGGSRPGAGRPAGKLTRHRRNVLEYVLARERQGEPVIIGEMVRRCGLHDRSAAMRIMRELRKLGYMPPKPVND